MRKFSIIKEENSFQCEGYGRGSWVDWFSFFIFFIGRIELFRVELAILGPA